MAGADKALLQVGKDLQLDRILASAGGGFAAILVSYNRDVPDRKDWSQLRWIGDSRHGFQGPLAGLEALLLHAATPWLLTLPVDLARPSPDIIELLLAGEGGRSLSDGDGRQPLVCLWPVQRALPEVRAALDRGERAVHAVLDQLKLESASIAPRRLGNLNTPQDLDELP